jgi:hypothetical protein
LGRFLLVPAMIGLKMLFATASTNAQTAQMLNRINV